jgi:hypothetical protein
MQSIHAGHEEKRIGALKGTSKVSLARISYINIIFYKISFTEKVYFVVAKGN